MQSIAGGLHQGLHFRESEQIGRQGQVRLRRNLEQLVGSYLRRQWRAVRVRVENCVGVQALAQYSQRPLLSDDVVRGQQRVCRVVPATVANGDGLQRIAVGIHRQRHYMADARIGELLVVDVVELTLVVVVDGLARMGEEHRVPVLAFGLKQLDREVAL